MLRLCVLLVLSAVLPLAASELFTATNIAEGTLYSDQVARQPGDLVTILVQERTTISEDHETETSRESSSSISGSLTPKSAAERNIPTFSFGSEKDFQGEGSYSAKGDLRTTISGRVIDRLDNGNLVIEARRTLQVDDNSRTIVLSGIIRAADLSTGNTVQSSKIHNFQIGIDGEGPLSRAQQEGLLSRLLDILWPL